MARSVPEKKLAPVHDWRTTDADEIDRRRLRARDETFTITNAEPRHPVFSNFRVTSGSGLTYSVEIRDLRERQWTCDCVDFRISGLGICKHVEALLLHLKARHPRLFGAAAAAASPRVEVVLDAAADTIRVQSAGRKLPRAVAKWFDGDGRLAGAAPDEALAALEHLRASKHPEIRISQEIPPWLLSRRRAMERVELRREYEHKVQSAAWPAQETTVPLFPYQREGMLHLAFTERALLADEMGLGKTIQAIAACALLRRLGKARRVLIVTPASLKGEWEEQIGRFTALPCQLVFGGKKSRLAAYETPTFFTIANYEQMVGDALDVNARLAPDVVVLDEAQRIKNWSTKTAQAVKRLRSRYAFVLTGTPIENRIDELHSLMDFLDPAVLGPLFRFNRDFYELDERGRPVSCRNLDQLHNRLRPYLLRRRKADVETELPERTDENRFVPLSERQRTRYSEFEDHVARLAARAKRRPLTRQEQEKLMRLLAMMRMTCDTNFILDSDDRTCPKLGELEKILDECRENNAKVIVFSEWERMLHLVRDLCRRHGHGHAWHTGSVPQKRRRAEIAAFKSDPTCRVFLSTDSGATGLNLQSASVVINCDLPWNPARLEQRIARAWRKHQTRPVSVINLITENTLEHRMLETLALKQTLAESVLDHPGTVTEIRLRGSRQAFLERLQQLLSPADAGKDQHLQSAAAATARPADPAAAFALLARDRIGGALLRCEERYPEDGEHSVLVAVVDRDAPSHRERLVGLHVELFGSGKVDPLAPTLIEVLDRATDDALQRLLAAGLIARTTRAARTLFPVEESTSKAPLATEERSRADAFRSQAARRLKAGRLLGEGDLLEDAREAVFDAAHQIARALAIESRVPEPPTLGDALAPPLAYSLGEAWSRLRPVLADRDASWRQIAELLEPLLA